MSSLAVGFAFFVVFFLLQCFSLFCSASLFSVFSSFTSCPFWLCVVLCVSLLLVLSPPLGRSLMLGGALSPCFFPLATCVAWLPASLSLRFSFLALARSFLVLPVLGVVFRSMPFFPAVFWNSFSFFVYILFQLFLGVGPSSSGLLLRLVAAIRVPFLFFSVRFIFSVLFPSLLLWYARSSCFPRHSGFRFVSRVASYGSCWGSFFSLPFVLHFSACGFSACPLWFFSMPLRLLCVYLFSMVFVPVLRILRLRRLFAFALLLFSSVLWVLLGIPLVVRVLLPGIFAGFLSLLSQPA